MIGEPPAGEYEELEVEIIKESWNTYDLEDGSRLRTRSILTKVQWPKGVEPKVGVAVQLGASFSQLVVVFAPSRLRGARNPNPITPGTVASVKSEEVVIVDSKEDWNIYRLPGNRGGIKTRMVITSVFRMVDQFDQEGNPLYVVNSTVAAGPTTPRELPPA